MNLEKYIEPYTEDPKKAEKERQQFLDDINNLIEQENIKANIDRNEFISPKKVKENHDFYVKELEKMIGFPYSKKDEIPMGKRVESTFVKEENGYSWYRMRIEVMRNFFAYGILVKKDNEKLPLLFNQNGFLGTPEILNGWVYNSANYNHMVRRSMELNVHIFSMQGLLWDKEYYGTSFDRVEIDSKLKNIGGSITSLEMLMFSRCLDYFEKQDYIDKDRIGIMGLSYGGMHTLYFSALDSRIKIAYSSCFLHDDSLYRFADWSYFNMLKKFKSADIAGLIAPRKLFIEIAKMMKYLTIKREKKRLRE